MAHVPLSPKAFIDGYTRISYTDLVDKYTYLVDLVEDLTSTDDNAGHDWCHVAYTADSLGPLLSDRDFLTFDFTSFDHNLVISRSCRHPAEPPKPPPSWYNWVISPSVKHMYRSPLFFFTRTLEVPNDPSQSMVVQCQFSDVGGIVPVVEQVKAVVQFGIDNTPKIVSHLAMAMEKGVRLGEFNGNSKPNDPLKPSWRQDPLVMLGLK